MRKNRNKIFRRINSFFRKIPLIMESLLKIYRTGGYSKFDISFINHGQILKGKNVLITGGGSGIGLSIARKSIQEGASVVITGRSKSKLEEVKNEICNPSLQILEWDVSQISIAEEKISKVQELFGSDIDILINNAGIVNGTQFPNVTEIVWDQVYSINSKGLFFLTQSLCNLWMKNDFNKIKKVINISSQGGFVGATYPYRMTKWDIAGLTQGLGIKLASKGIIVNGIAPGIIATDMQPNCLKQGDNVYYSENPIKRFALPEEIAELAVFLMSDAANFIVGQTIVCDGGYSIK